MWSAFGNGSGAHVGSGGGGGGGGGVGGGGGGGGYVPSQGWEFIPGSGLERAGGGRGKNRSPLRRISSPPAVFNYIHEPQYGGGGVTPLEVLRRQLWSGPETHQLQQQQQQQQTQQQQQQQTQQQQQQQQTQQQQTQQHTRLKKKLEDLKKRHEQDKEEWMREKESLLREVADIQGGENRRILLDLKSVLEEVQVEVKREEEKRNKLQLQYTRDRCAWDLEKAELKSRIAQLEIREGGGLALGGGGGGVVQVQPAEAGAASWGPVPPSETPTLQWEREEQRRLLADTHSAAMDLRCRLELNEQDWLRERAELLQRFDSERREWESQLRDMQRKIEKLYCEVRSKREGTGVESLSDAATQEDEDDDDVALRLGSPPAATTGSSVGQSEPPKHPAFPGFYHRDRSGSASQAFRLNNPCDPNAASHFVQDELLDPMEQKDRLSVGGDFRNTGELELALCQVASPCGMAKRSPEGEEMGVGMSPEDSLAQRNELGYGTDKKNTTALNAALKEIARVSEELCSYQEEIRRKCDKSEQPVSLSQLEEKELMQDCCKLRGDEPLCDLSQIYDDLCALERENWPILSPDNNWHNNSNEAECLRNNSQYEVDGSGEPPAPPVPPRTTSWHLSSPTQLEPELYIPETPVTTARKCHSPCVLVDRKCHSPSVVRKFEAMLQENEGKVLTNGMVMSCSAPTNTNCNVGCCHNRWSGDASKFTNSKTATYMPAQKSFSEVNILMAGKDSKCKANAPVEHPISQIVKELSVDLLLTSLEMPPTCPNLHSSKRNIMLEQKTAEFNRTLFQAEMGHGVEDKDGCIIADASSVSLSPAGPARCATEDVKPPRIANFDLIPQSAEVTSDLICVRSEVRLSPSTFDHPASQNPDIRLRRTGCDPQGEEDRAHQAAPSDLSPQHSLLRLRESNPQTTTLHPGVKRNAQIPNRPSSQHCADTEILFPGRILPTQNAPGTSPKTEKPSGPRVQPVKVGSSPKLPAVRTRPTQVAQAEPQEKQGRTSGASSQSDPLRPGPRVMNDHPWKPLTLAAYPRPEGSRSNYGAVEKILKSYESVAWAKQSREMSSAPNLSPRQEEKVKELSEELDRDVVPSPPAPRLTDYIHTSHTHTTKAQLSCQSAVGVNEIELLVQEGKVASPLSSHPPEVQKNFSRPACPTNRRLPARWASRSSSSSFCSSSSSSSSPSPSATAVALPSDPVQKRASTFAYSHAFHIETLII